MLGWVCTAVMRVFTASSPCPRGWPSTATTWSPGRSPATAAGESGLTPVTTMPAPAVIPSGTPYMAPWANSAIQAKIKLASTPAAITKARWDKGRF